MGIVSERDDEKALEMDSCHGCTTRQVYLTPLNWRKVGMIEFMLNTFYHQKTPTEQCNTKSEF